MAGVSSTLTRLLQQPQRFRFDAVLRVLMRRARVSDPAAAARFVAEPNLGFPGSEVGAVQAGHEQPPRVRVPLIGLIGATGVLPQLYGQMAAVASRRGSAALQDFLDLLSHRMVAFFGAAGIKYRPHRSAETAAQSEPPKAPTSVASTPVAASTAVAASTPVAAPTAGVSSCDPVANVLLALTGHGTPGLVDRLATGCDPLLHYAGLFAMRPRSAERLAAMLSDWLGQPVEVRQFAGSWLRLGSDQRTALPGPGSPGTWHCLGVDAAIGVQSWDVQARIVLRIGPLDRAGFEALLPGRPAHERLVSLVRSFLGLETGFAINPVLARDALFPSQLGEPQPAPSAPVHRSLLGWNTWLTPPGYKPAGDAADALFDAG